MALALASDVVVGFLDRSDALHGAAEAALGEVAAHQQLAVSAITYAEVLTGARIGHHDEAAVAGFFSEVIAQIVPVGAEIAERAAQLRAERQGLRMPDALIVASAELGEDVEVLLSGDRKLAGLKGLRCEVRLL